MTTLFISDLHLDAERPQITELFGRFLREEARGADALYILGDLFEAWVGDDDPSETGAFVADELRAVADAGTPVSFIHGNRDFLLGDSYARRAGMAILPDPSVILLYGRPTLLMHGDTLCTDDLAYQQFRSQTRNPAWQAQFLAQPLAARLAFAQQARAASKAHQSGLQSQGTMETITDVAAATVADTFTRFGIDTLIHGHTHRPAVHTIDIGGTPRERIVLGDWYEQGSVLRLNRDGHTLESLSQGSEQRGFCSAFPQPRDKHGARRSSCKGDPKGEYSELPRTSAFNDLKSLPPRSVARLPRAGRRNISPPFASTHKPEPAQPLIASPS